MKNTAKSEPIFEAEYYNMVGEEDSTYNPVRSNIRERLKYVRSMTPEQRREYHSRSEVGKELMRVFRDSRKQFRKKITLLIITGFLSLTGTLFSILALTYLYLN